MTVGRRGWRLALSADGRENVSDSLTTATDPQARGDEPGAWEPA
jgi:hypothetical protein